MSKRVSVKEVKKVNSRLKRQVAREEKRQQEIAKFRKENDELSHRLFALRNERNNTGECC
jgi:hypothetical protein